MWIKCQNKKIINTDCLSEIDYELEPLKENIQPWDFETEEEFLRKEQELSMNYKNLRVKIYAFRHYVIDGEEYTNSYEILNYENEKIIAKKVFNAVYEEVWESIRRDGKDVDVRYLISLFDENFYENVETKQ